MNKILINAKTLIKNPNAGQTDFMVYGPIVKYEEDNHIIIERSIEHFSTLTPDPKFLFEYNQVKCNYCSWEGYYSELNADDYGDAYSNEICPKCGKWDCLGDKQFETPEECLIRIKKKGGFHGNR